MRVLFRKTARKTTNFVQLFPFAHHTIKCTPHFQRAGALRRGRGRRYAHTQFTDCAPMILKYFYGGNLNLSFISFVLSTRKINICEEKSESNNKLFGRQISWRWRCCACCIFVAAHTRKRMCRRAMLRALTLSNECGRVKWLNFV